MRALKKKKKNQYCFLLRGCQENPTLVKYSMEEVKTRTKTL